MSMSVAHRSPVAPSTPEHALFTFPPAEAMMKAGAASPVASTSKVAEEEPGNRLRSIASHPTLSTLVEASPSSALSVPAPPKNTRQESSQTFVSNEDDEGAELYYHPPSYEPRQRTASLKSVHHHGETQDKRYSNSSSSRSSIMSWRSSYTKENNRPRSNTFGHQKHLSKSKSFSNLLSGAAGAFSGSKLAAAPESSIASNPSKISRSMSVDVGGETATLTSVATPTTSDSADSGGLSRPGLWTSNQYPNDQEDTPKGKAYVKTDNRRSLDSMRNVPKSAPDSEMSLFYIPPATKKAPSSTTGIHNTFLPHGPAHLAAMKIS